MKAQVLLKKNRSISLSLSTAPHMLAVLPKMEWGLVWPSARTLLSDMAGASGAIRIQARVVLSSSDFLRTDSPELPYILNHMQQTTHLKGFAQNGHMRKTCFHLGQLLLAAC